jgi:hypothetical protein
MVHCAATPLAKSIEILQVESSKLQVECVILQVALRIGAARSLPVLTLSFTGSFGSPVLPPFQPRKPTKLPENASMKPEEARNSKTKPKFRSKTANLPTWTPQRWATFHSRAR